MERTDNNGASLSGSAGNGPPQQPDNDDDQEERHLQAQTVLLGRGVQSTRPFFGGVGGERPERRSVGRGGNCGSPKFAGLLHGSVLRLGLRERRAARVVGQVRPTVGGIGVGGSRMLGSEAETPPLAGAVCVWGKPVLVLDVQGRRLRRDVRAWHAREAGT